MKKFLLTWLDSDSTIIEMGELEAPDLRTALKLAAELDIAGRRDVAALNIESEDYDA